MENEQSVMGTIPDGPELDDSGVGTQSVIRDASHCQDILNGLFDSNDERVKEAANIRRKKDGIDPPYDPQKLDEEGKNYKRNYSTGFLGTLIDRIVPRFVMRIKSVPFLTASKFPTNIPQSTLKTETFRTVVTNLIRNWAGWHFFLYELADQGVTFGKAFVTFDDELDWRPTVSRIDDAAVPNGTKQGTTPDYFGLKREYSVSEAYEFIADKDIARDAGWNIENMIKAINSAKPIREDDENPTDERAIDIQDVELELIKPESFTTEWNTVQMDILYAKEYDGTVTCMIIERESGDELFRADNMYSSMKDVVQFVCYDIGNGKVYGSMGVGQKLYDMSLNIEKSRNKAQDQLDIRGKYILTVKDAGELVDVQTSVTDEYIYVAGATVIGGNNAMPDNAEAFITTDRYLTGLAEEKVGAFTPDSMASDKTATQSQIDALKEAETRDAKMDYWLTYLGHVIHMMIRRAFNPATDDEDARIARKLCLDIMSEEELTLIVTMPPQQTGLDWTDLDRNKKVQFLDSKRGNPMWNQYWLERTISTLVIGQELTEAGLLPEGVNTLQIEAMRQQTDEVFSMLQQGVSVTVSPRDAHIYHMQVLSGEIDQQTQQWSGTIFGLLNDNNIEGAAAALTHYQEHYLIAEQQDILGEYQNTAKQFMADARNAIEKVAQAQAQAKQQQMIQQQAMQGAVPG